MISPLRLPVSSSLLILHIPYSDLSSTSKSHRNFFEFGRKGRDERRRFAQSLQRSLFKSARRDARCDVVAIRKLENGGGNQKHKPGTSSTHSFIVNRAFQALPRTPSEADGASSSRGTNQNDIDLQRSGLDSSQTKSSGTKTPKMETLKDSGSTVKKAFARGIRNSFVGLLGLNGPDDKDDSFGTTAKRQDEHPRKRYIRSMGLSYESLKGGDGNSEVMIAKRKNASMIELKIGSP